jgi:hypothetical protein
MSDIVERLRDGAFLSGTQWGEDTAEAVLMREAADEIERLRREVELSKPSRCMDDA